MHVNLIRKCLFQAQMKHVEKELVAEKVEVTKKEKEGAVEHQIKRNLDRKVRIFLFDRYSKVQPNC